MNIAVVLGDNGMIKEGDDFGDGVRLCVKWKWNLDDLGVLDAKRVWMEIQ
jgi:hypothetical protein